MGPESHSSKVELRIIKLYFDWFSKGYEDFGELENAEPRIVKDLLGNIDDSEERIRVGSLVMILRFLFFWGLQSEILS